MQRCISEGALRPNRTGVDTKTIFGMQMRYSLRESKAKVFYLFISSVILVLLVDCGNGFCDYYSNGNTIKYYY